MSLDLVVGGKMSQLPLNYAYLSECPMLSVTDVMYATRCPLHGDSNSIIKLIIPAILFTKGAPMALLHAFF